MIGLGLIWASAKWWPAAKRWLQWGLLLGAIGLGWATCQGIYQRGHRAGAAQVQAAWAEERTRQLEAAREQEESFTKKLQEAQNAATEKEQTLRANLAAANSAAGGLRSTIAQLGRKLSSYPACPSTEAALTAAELLGECAGEYRDMAEQAERHAADAAMMQAAWPSLPRARLHE